MDEIIYPEHLKSNLLNLLHNNTARIEESFGISLALRGNKIMYDGHSQNQKKFKHYMNYILKLSAEKGELNASDIDMSLSMVEEDKIEAIPKELDKKIKIIINGKEVAPKTFNQKEYLKAILNNDMAFGIGPAGTGKTFLAISIALHHLLTKKVERIVLTRPVVEAGEKLGFLPGDIQQKVNPYFRPLYDALYHLIGFEKTAELIDKEIIEIAPLAYMRGRTIDNAFIILDEGQNTLNSQMKMFLTRFGQNSKVVVTADISQIDLPEPNKSGIFRAIKILKNIRGIKIVTLTKHDVVRHQLVQKIIDAYDLSEGEKK
ncbi:MAG TPA: PhoH family protein [Candidatus Deferrimicrobium sp.]|nr:PhoH family protein [Candidatus Deferrimicrobium sp.]